MLCYACPKSSVAQNNPHNIYPNLNANPALPGINGDGRVGIGAVGGTQGGGLLAQPMDLLHIHGVNPITGSLYNEPTLRISLDDVDPNITGTRLPCIPTGTFLTCPSQIFGLLSMQNDFTIVNITPPIVRYSSFAKKYDFVLSTANPIDPDLTQPAHCPYKFDMIISAKNPLASIRFGTTPTNAVIIRVS